MNYTAIRENLRDTVDMLDVKLATLGGGNTAGIALIEGFMAGCCANDMRQLEKAARLDWGFNVDHPQIHVVRTVLRNELGVVSSPSF